MWYIFECLWENWDSTLDTNKANSEISGLARIHSIMLSQVLETCFNRAMILTVINFLSIEKLSTEGITLNTFFVFFTMKTKTHMHPSRLHHNLQHYRYRKRFWFLDWGIKKASHMYLVLPKDYNMYKPIYGFGCIQASSKESYLHQQADIVGNSWLRFGRKLLLHWCKTPPSSPSNENTTTTLLPKLTPKLRNTRVNLSH